MKNGNCSDHGGKELSSYKEIIRGRCKIQKSVFAAASFRRNYYGTKKEKNESSEET